MSQQSKVYFAGLAIATILGLLLGRSLMRDDRISVLQPTSLLESTPSPQSQLRQWKTPVFSKVCSQSGLLNASLVRPGLQGDVFVFDWGDMQVKRFSYDCTLLSEFGGGPGEFMNPTDIAIKEDGGVVIADPKKGMTMVFDRDGKPDTPLRLASTPCRIGFLRDGLSVGIPSVAADDLFEVYDAEGRKLRSFGRFIEHQFDDSICLDGWLAPGSRDCFVYVGSYVGIIASYDRDGNRRFLVSTVDGSTVPSIEVTSLGSRRIPPSTPKYAESISTTTDRIYIMKGTDHEGRHVQSIDVYSLTSGAYQYSFELPEKCTRVLVTDSHIYTLNHDSLSKWEWTQPIV